MFDPWANRTASYPWQKRYFLSGRVARVRVRGKEEGMEGGRLFWGLSLQRTLMDFGVMCFFSLNTWHMELFSLNHSTLIPIMMRYAKVTDWLLVSQIVQNENVFLRCLGLKKNKKNNFYSLLCTPNTPYLMGTACSLTEVILTPTRIKYHSCFFFFI